ncbi:hypothetical protein AVEN_131825-1 [Araneus ventricosus]|uniref:Uncharacterized protein n=1 Tax=Araneus ventricosus TaxID=182803 RepID=A0A4Y2WWL4_ARAVE|nr:hypothetical protein AVEN_131825-1 [Araneus ventricosus]
MCGKYSACSIIAELLDVTAGFFDFCPLLVRNCYRGLLSFSKRDIWESRSCVWGQRERLPNNGTIPFKTGRMVTLGIPHQDRAFNQLFNLAAHNI